MVVRSQRYNIELVTRPDTNQDELINNRMNRKLERDEAERQRQKELEEMELAEEEDEDIEEVDSDEWDEDEEGKSIKKCEDFLLHSNELIQQC